MTQTLTKERFIYPPRPSSSIPLDEAKALHSMGFNFQLKFADTRNLIYFNRDGSITLWNRHGKVQKQFKLNDELTTQLEQVRQLLGVKPGQLTVIDGGIIHNKTKFIKNTLVMWDILVLNDIYLVGTTYDERYQKLLDITNYDYNIFGFKVGSGVTENIFIPTTFDINAELDNQWSNLMQINDKFGWKNGIGDPAIEGVVLKRPDGVLSYSFKEENNTDWSIRCRIPTKRNHF